MEISFSSDVKSIPVATSSSKNSIETTIEVETLRTIPVSTPSISRLGISISVTSNMKRFFGFDITNTPDTKTVKSINERKSDPRMNKAVDAKIANEALSPTSALRLGGFIIPDDATGKTVIDGTSLNERKNYLHKRFKWKKQLSPNEDRITPKRNRKGLSQKRKFRKPNKSRRDPRMNKAVEAKLANDALSPVSAMRLGGYIIPDIALGRTIIDGISLENRKKNFAILLRNEKLFIANQAETAKSSRTNNFSTLSTTDSEIVPTPKKKKS